MSVGAFKIQIGYRSPKIISDIKYGELISLLNNKQKFKEKINIFLAERKI